MERQVKKLIYFSLYWIIYNSLISRYIWSNEIIAFIPDIIIFYLFFTNIKKLWKAPFNAYNRQSDTYHCEDDFCDRNYRGASEHE